MKVHAKYTLLTDTSSESYGALCTVSREFVVSDSSVLSSLFDLNGRVHDSARNIVYLVLMMAFLCTSLMYIANPIIPTMMLFFIVIGNLIWRLWVLLHDRLHFGYTAESKEMFEKFASGEITYSAAKQYCSQLSISHSRVSPKHDSLLSAVNNTSDSSCTTTVKKEDEVYQSLQRSIQDINS